MVTDMVADIVSDIVADIVAECRQYGRRVSSHSIKYKIYN